MQDVFDSRLLEQAGEVFGEVFLLLSLGFLTSFSCLKFFPGKKKKASPVTCFWNQSWVSSLSWFKEQQNSKSLVEQRSQIQQYFNPFPNYVTAPEFLWGLILSIPVFGGIRNCLRKGELHLIGGKKNKNSGMLGADSVLIKCYRKRGGIFNFIQILCSKKSSEWINYQHWSRGNSRDLETAKPREKMEEEFRNCFRNRFGWRTKFWLIFGQKSAGMGKKCGRVWQSSSHPETEAGNAGGIPASFHEIIRKIEW